MSLSHCLIVFLEIFGKSFRRTFGKIFRSLFQMSFVVVVVVAAVRRSSFVVRRSSLWHGKRCTHQYPSLSTRRQRMPGHRNAVTQGHGDEVETTVTATTTWKILTSTPRAEKQETRTSVGHEEQASEWFMTDGALSQQRRWQKHYYELTCGSASVGTATWLQSCEITRDEAIVSYRLE